MLFVVIIKLILPYLCLILIPVFWGISDGYRILDPIKYSTLWHRYKGFVQLLIGVIVACDYSLGLALLFAIYFWIVFDMSEAFTRGIKFEHIGKSAFFDKIFPSFWSQFIVKTILLSLTSFNLFVLSRLKMKTYVLVIINGDSQNERFVITTKDIRAEKCFEFSEKDDNVLKYKGEYYTYSDVTEIKSGM